MLTKGLIFVGGVAVGLLIAKLYAQYEVKDALHTGLDKIGLGGGAVEAFADNVIVPQFS